MTAAIPPGDAIAALELGPELRLGVYVPGGAGHRLLTIGAAPSTLDAPHFDLTPAYEEAVAAVERSAGSYAFARPPYGESLAERAARVAALTGSGIAGRPTVFLVGNLVARDLEALVRVLDEAGLAMAGRATTAVRAFRDRVDGPSVVESIAAQTPDVIMVALTDDTGEGLDYVTDLLVGGLAGRESGYAPIVVLLYSGTPDSQATARIERAFPLYVRQVRGGAPNEPMDMGAPLTAIADVSRRLRARAFAGRVVPDQIARARSVPFTSALEASTRRLALGQRLDTAVASLEHDSVTVVSYARGVSEIGRFGAGGQPERPFHLGLQTPIERVARWAADEPLPQAQRAFVLNRTAHPSAVPATVAELQLMHATWITAVSESLQASSDGHRLLEDGRIDLAVLTGLGARCVGRPVQAALLLINALQPSGVTQLAVDTPSALAMSGALLEADVPVEVESSLAPLGLCVAPRGQAKAGETGVVVEVHPENGAAIEREVSPGTLDVVQWDPGLEASIRVWPGPRFDMGLGAGRPAELKTHVQTGTAGLIIDARGRPLGVPEDPDGRRAHIQQWHRAVDAYAAPSPVETARVA